MLGLEHLRRGHSALTQNASRLPGTSRAQSGSEVHRRLILGAMLTIAAAVHGCSAEASSTRTEDQKLKLKTEEHGGTPGGSVAVNGDTLVVASPFRRNGALGSGAAYAFEPVDGLWTLRQELSRTDVGADDDFGRSVSVSGDTVVVGAPGQRRGVSNDHQGAVYVFVRRQHIWSLQQKLLAPDDELVTDFGKAVGVSGDNAIVGASSKSANGTLGEAPAYAFARTDGAWSLQQEIAGSMDPTGTGFGSSVSLSGDTAVLGAPDEKLDGKTPQGAVYVYLRTGATWSLQQRLSGKADSLGADFGISLAVDGSTLVVGEDIQPGSRHGAAYLYMRSGDSWSRQQKLVASDGTSDNAFGSAVSLSGNTVVVGALAQPVQVGGGPGAAYVFIREGGAFTQHLKLVAHDGLPNDLFGSSVAVEPHSVIVGAAGYAYNEGAAYAFKTDQ